ncbi:hypothetical protein T439DRAFT_380007 [Meredithblackwellia eburnea MCA 4105]
MNALDTVPAGSPLHQNSTRHHSTETAYVDRLPNDVLDMVMMDYIARDVRSGRFALLEASLVCRRWRWPAQRALFSYVQLDPQRAERWLASTSLHKGSLREMVLWGFFDEPKLFADIFGQPGNLEALKHSDSMYHSVEWSFLRLPGLKGLRRLSISGCFTLSDPVDSSDMELTLEEVAVESCPRSTGQAPPQTSRFFRALFSGASTTLKRFNLCLMDSGECLLPQISILSSCLSHLSLKLDITSDYEDAQITGLQQLLSRLTMLKSLELLNLDTVYMWKDLDRILTNVPQGQIHYLKLHVSFPGTFAWELSHLLRTQRALAIKRLTLQKAPTMTLTFFTLDHLIEAGGVREDVDSLTELCGEVVWEGWPK